MWNFQPFKARREHELKLAALKVEEARLATEALIHIGAQYAASLTKIGEMTTTLADAQKQSVAVLQTWLEGFKMTELPYSSTVRDEDEVRMARERVLKDAGLPPSIPPELALAYLLHQEEEN